MKLLLLLLFLLLSGCLWSNTIVEEEPSHEPIYMSYEELRSSVYLSEPQPIKKRGKIYLYDSYIFLNEPNKGVHIIDNSDPSAPTQMSFINVPGNVDIAIKNGILYLDSFVDLIAIDISKTGMFRITKRLENVFEYDAYQTLEDKNVYMSYDETKGVVIGVKERS